MLRGVAGMSFPSAASPFQKMERSYTLRTGGLDLKKYLRKMLRIFWGWAELKQPVVAAGGQQWKIRTLMSEIKRG